MRSNQKKYILYNYNIIYKLFKKINTLLYVSGGSHNLPVAQLVERSTVEDNNAEIERVHVRFMPGRIILGLSSHTQVKSKRWII